MDTRAAPAGVAAALPFGSWRKPNRKAPVVLSGWGCFPRVGCRLHEPSSEHEIRSILTGQSSLIARGNGRAYGDAALNPEATLAMRRFDRILTFDEREGRIVCEGGALLSDVVAHVARRGWLPPVLPGTAHVSIGGMIAADVHGKNHPQAGSFAGHVGWLDLMVSDGTILRCSPAERHELFEATLGGMGLTGIVLRAAFKLMRIESAWMLERTIRCETLEETFAAFEANRHVSYAVAWIDCLSGRQPGRSLLRFGEHAPLGQTSAQRAGIRLTGRLQAPWGLGTFFLNRSAVSAVNNWYFSRAKAETRLVPFEKFFFPLDRLSNWNQLYGRRGLVQYQFAVPSNAARHVIGATLDQSAKAGLSPFLAVLKRFGAGRRMLSFPIPGYTLALDFPVTEGTVSMLSGWDRMVAEAGGRIYLAKDALSEPALIARSYPGLPAFLAVRNEIDPRRRLSSLLSRRIGL